MKLDLEPLRFISKDEFRVLTAIEMGMRNHELVPTQLIENIAGLRHGGVHSAIATVAKHKLLHHERKLSAQDDGYRLTYSGYDFLAVHALVQQSVLSHVGQKLGVGKESGWLAPKACLTQDNHVYRCVSCNKRERTIKNKRDYLKNRKTSSWLYMSRLSALKEYAFLKCFKVLFDNDFPVPKPHGVNRHCVVMEKKDAIPLNAIREIRGGKEGAVFGSLMALIVKLGEHGLVHCDFNEFNLLIDDNGTVTLIDFPQMVSIDHPNAKNFFEKDVECLRLFFERRFGFVADSVPMFEDIVREKDLDHQADASGVFTSNEKSEMEEVETYFHSLQVDEDELENEEASSHSALENEITDDDDDNLGQTEETGKEETEEKSGGSDEESIEQEKVVDDSHTATGESRQREDRSRDAALEPGEKRISNRALKRLQQQQTGGKRSVKDAVKQKLDRQKKASSRNKVKNRDQIKLGRQVKEDLHSL